MIGLANKKNIEYGKILSRDEVLVMLSDNLQDINHKLKHGKIRDKTNAKIKNAQLNSLVYLAQNYLLYLMKNYLEAADLLVNYPRAKASVLLASTSTALPNRKVI